MSRKKELVTIESALSPQQLQAVDLLAGGATVTAAAAEIGAARETVSRWRSNDVMFMQVLSERQAALWEASADRLRSNAVKAAARLADLLEHENPEIALKAIGLTFKVMGNYPKKGRAHIMGPTEIGLKINRF